MGRLELPGQEGSRALKGARAALGQREVRGALGVMATLGGREGLEALVSAG